MKVENCKYFCFDEKINKKQIFGLFFIFMFFIIENMFFMIKNYLFFYPATTLVVPHS